MISTTLLPAIALTLGGGHAELHPANANIFLEVPEVRALLATYHEAPLARLIADPEIQAFVGPLTGQAPEDVTLRSLTQTALAELRKELPDVGLHILDLVNEVDRASFSLSGANLDGLGDLVAAAEGELSEGLLERMAGVHVRVVLDFSSAEVADQAAALIRSHAQQPDDESSGPWSLVKHTARSDEQPAEWSIHTIDEAELPFSLFVSNEANRLSVGLGFLQGLEQPPVITETLADRASYQAAGKHLAGDAGVTIVSSYVAISGLGEVPAMLALIPDVPEVLPQMAGKLMRVVCPAGQVESRSTARLVKGRFVTKSFERSFTTADAPSWSSAEPVTRANFRMAPPDAVGVWALNLDKDGLRKYLMEALSQLSGEDPEQVLATLDQEYGLRPERDLIEPLGGELVFYTMPFAGIGMPKMFVALELDDSESFARGLEGVAAYLGEVAGDAIDIHSKPYRKQPFMSFSPGKDLVEMTAGTNAGGMAAMTPAFVSLSASVGVLDDRAIIALSSMYVKREIKRLLKAEGDEQHPVMTTGDEFPSGVQSYGTTDWGVILAGIYDSIRGFLPLIEQGADITLPFSIDEMPDSAIFPRYIQSSITWTQDVDGGLYRYAESAFGPEIPFMLGAGVGVGGLLVAREQSSMDPVAHEVIIIHEDASDEDKTRHTMRELKVALQVHKAEHGHYPAALGDLLTATDNFPQGLLESSSVPVDAWGHAFIYGQKDEGASFLLYSSGPDGVDGQGEGDDLVVARKG